MFKNQRQKTADMIMGDVIWQRTRYWLIEINKSHTKISNSEVLSPSSKSPQIFTRNFLSWRSDYQEFIINLFISIGNTHSPFHRSLSMRLELASHLNFITSDFTFKDILAWNFLLLSYKYNGNNHHAPPRLAFLKKSSRQDDWPAPQDNGMVWNFHTSLPQFGPFLPYLPGRNTTDARNGKRNEVQEQNWLFSKKSFSGKTSITPPYWFTYQKIQQVPIFQKTFSYYCFIQYFDPKKSKKGNLRINASEMVQSLVISYLLYARKKGFATFIDVC